jgi:hypothetical protein
VLGDVGRTGAQTRRWRHAQRANLPSVGHMDPSPRARIAKPSLNIRVFFCVTRAATPLVRSAMNDRSQTIDSDEPEGRSRRAAARGPPSQHPGRPSGRFTVSRRDEDWLFALRNRALPLPCCKSTSGALVVASVYARARTSRLSHRSQGGIAVVDASSKFGTTKPLLFAW